MITYKSNDDFMNMKKAGKIVSTIHSELQNMSLAGTRIEELDKKAEEIITKSNSISNFFNFYSVLNVSNLLFENSSIYLNKSEN